MKEDAYDVVVVGGGAAGLSAALVLGRARRRVAVIDAGAPRNAPATHMHGFLSRDGMPPAGLLAEGRDEVAGYGVELSPLNAVLMRLAVGGAPAGGMNPFPPPGLDRSRLVRLAWSGFPDGWPQDRPGPAEASVRLEVPGGYGHTATHMRVEADVVVRRSAATDIARQQHAANAPLGLPPHWRVAPQQLGGLIDAMLATLTGKSPPRWPA